MTPNRGLVLSLVALFCFGCNKDWSGEKLCSDALAQVIALHDPDKRARDYSTFLRGVESLGGKKAFASACADAIRDAVTACSEHAYGSDSGENCKQRRIVPAMSEAIEAVYVRGERIPAPPRETRQDRARKQIAGLVEALVRYHREKGDYPATASGLQPLLDLKFAASATDPWGNEYLYFNQGGGKVRVVSYGGDGTQGGEGDDADIMASVP